MAPRPDIAGLSVDAVRADGETFVLELGISAPYVSDRLHTWVCALTLSPLLAAPREVAAEDSVQALSLTLRAARSLLEDFTDKGGKLLIEGRPLPLDVWLGPTL